MSLPVRFLVYNLLPSLAAGLLAWSVVFVAIRLLRIRSSSLSICFFSLPLLKSILVLLGVGLIFQWPLQWFDKWRNLALPIDQALPILLVWSAGIYLVYFWIVRHARQVTLQGARPAAVAAPRLAVVYENVLADFRKAPCPQCSDDLCGTIQLKSKPRLLVSDRINSPMALTGGGEPLILFPVGLVSRLRDGELAGALAHELAHFYLRLPVWCSVGTLQKLTLINPAASLVGEYLHRQEEKACDELAVSIVGQPELYAEMLTSSYRFAKEQAGRTMLSRLHVLPRLVGFKPLLSERVEHLLQAQSTPEGWMPPRVVTWLVWTLLFWILFFRILPISP
ncbi:MAG: M56 family metallopeptidase [Omnitrophica WOR_2 bacterium]